MSTSVSTIDATNRIRTLGGFSVTVSGVEIPYWRAGRGRHLLQYLIAHAGQPIAKHAIIEAVWGDSAAKNPHVALKVAICTLRGLLLDAHQRGGGSAEPGIWIVSEPGAYRLRLHDTTVDVDDFEAAVQGAYRLADIGRPADAYRSFRSAVDLNAGTYLPDCSGAWAAVRRERVNDRLLAALAELAAEARRRGEHRQLLDLHQRMLDIDPCREESYRELMRWHGAARQPARVQDWYLACVRQLKTRLGLEPDRRTQALFYEAITGRVLAYAADRDGAIHLAQERP
jgi:two-component SAPR family response regulator